MTINIYYFSCLGSILDNSVDNTPPNGRTDTVTFILYPGYNVVE